MASGREEGPVYYREIQKNAYLKRIPNDITGGKLRPLGSKKAPLKPLWTQLCVHNGRTPYLEQYPETECAATLAHKPLWRACLSTARHVTASVKPHSGEQYDFLIDTDNGAVRMLAPDWESMQDWVTTLRNTLHELKILSKGENVYCVAPAPLPPPPPPRAAARDPTSPLPPTPPIPPDRVPGIELTPTIRAVPPPDPPTPEPEPPPPQTEDIDISNWEATFTLPSTSQGRQESDVRKESARKSGMDGEMTDARGVTKICGQNICLDDSLFKRDVTSDDEFFAQMDKMSDDEDDDEYKQRVVVSGDKQGGESSNTQATNITVIQVSNKEPPHTAIPVLGPETNIFDFDFKNQVTITDPINPSFVNIVNTEENGYGTTFPSHTQTESDYGHLSLTTTVSLTGTNEFTNETNLQPTCNSLPVTCNSLPVTCNSLTTTSSNLTTTSNQDEVYERLCMASTSNSKPSPLPVRKLKNTDKSRKSSLPNLEVGESTYEYLFLSNNNASAVTLTPEVNCNGDRMHVNNGERMQVNNGERMQVNNGERIQGNNGERVQVNSEANHDLNRVRSVERSRSQNAYDLTVRTRENVNRRVQNNSPKRDGRNVSENTEQIQPQKPIWRRGLTELSLLTRLRSIGHTKKHESPTRQDDNHDRSPTVTSPVKVVHRSRPEARVDSTRRRSSSFSNGQSPTSPAAPSLVPLRARQAAALRAEQRRGAALVATLSVRDGPVFADYDNQVWVSWWGTAGPRTCGRAGDRVAGLRGRQPTSAAQARTLLHANSHTVDILFHRVPLGKIYIVNKRDQESIGIKLDSECNIVRVEPHSAAARAGLPPTGHWALTEINNRPINLLKGGEEDMNRLSKHGTEVSILIQPSALVKKLRSALKGHKTLLGLR